MQFSGQFRCRTTRFEVDGPPLLTAACHCEGCQRMTGGPYSLSALYKEARFRVTAGSPVLGGLKEATQHFFCPECLSWMFTRPAGLDDMVNIRTPMLTQAREFASFLELYTDEGLEAAVGVAPHSFAAAPDVETFLELSQSYQSWDKRPH